MEESKPCVGKAPNKTATTYEPPVLRDDDESETNQKAAVENHRNQGVPKHVGLICDGNGRWATQKNLPRAAGHLEGARRLVDLVRALVREKRKKKKPNSSTSSGTAVSFLTLYAFSTENWNRSPSEITKIFEAIQAAATAVLTAGDLARVDVRVLGDLSDERIPKSLKKVLWQLEERTETRRRKHKGRPQQESNEFLEVCLAVNYGGRSDIVSACRALAREVEDGTLCASDITEDLLQQNLSSGSRPPPDMIVRTGGEHRLSNFLLWESAYAELFVSPVLWPDFSFEGEFKRSLEWYSTRKRNFGGREEESDGESTERTGSSER